MRTFNHRPWSLAAALVALLVASAACDREDNANGGGDTPPDTTPADTTGGGQAITPEQATREVTAVLQGVTRAAAGGDLAALQQYYAPDVHVIDFAGFTEGWESYRSNNLERTAQTLARSVPSNYRIGTATVKVDGNVAWAAFPYGLVAEVEGRPTEIFGYGSATLRHEGGRWLIVQTQTSGRPRRDGDPTF